MNTLVVAKYLEDVSWVARVPPGWDVIVYDKGARGLPNIAREDYCYLFHIVTHYENLDGDIAFVQGNPFDHCPKLLDLMSDPAVRIYGWCEDCDNEGRPRIEGLDLAGYCRSLGIDPRPVWKFVAGAQFRVAADQIHRHPRSVYQSMMQTCRVRSSAPWLFERLWPTVFDLPV